MLLLWVRQLPEGYSITTRTGAASTRSLLARFGDKIFDAGKDRSKRRKGR